MNHKRGIALYVAVDIAHFSLPYAVFDSPKEMAEGLGVPIATIYSSLFRQRKGFETSYIEVLFPKGELDELENN